MATTPSSNLIRILEHLSRHQVEYVLVGAYSAVFLGYPVSTHDVDIVFDLDPANCERLLTAITELEAIYRGQFGRRITPKLDWLINHNFHLLDTKHGRLDLLREVDPGLGYHDLVKESVTVEREVGFAVRVIKLEKLIELKRAVGRVKDLHSIYFLEKLIEERKKKGMGDAD